MKKGDIGKGIIGESYFPDSAYIEYDGEKVLIKKGIPGQMLEFVITKKKKGKLEGRVLNIIEKSEQEDNEEPCVHYEICGGCTYQTLSYENQLKLKDKQLRALMEGATDKDFVWEGVIPSPKYLAYRNKMEFSFGDERKDGELALGMHKKGSHYDIVNVFGCKIVDSDFTKILELTLNFFSERKVSYFHKNTHTGFLRHLLIRRSEYSGELLVSLVTTSSFEFVEDPNTLLEPSVLGADEEILIKEWADYIKEETDRGILNGSIGGILHTKNDSYADAVLNQGTTLLYGKDYIIERLNGLDFKITPFSFFQTNSKGAEVLYNVAGKYLGDTAGKSVFDLYSGTGTIAQLLASESEKVYGVEIVEEAVEAAIENAKNNGLSNCEFIAGDVLKVVDTLGFSPDIIILDPPRDGIHPKALPKILEFGAKRIVYISCKPTSFVRDLKMMEAAGYRMEKCVGVDMFPNTVNCECVVLLSRP
jgi:23S rRNA (uracil-5-)-methyltransferase rumA